MSKKAEQEHQEEEQEEQEEAESFIVVEETPKTRIIGICGEINEEVTSETIYGMLLLKDAGKKEVLSDPEDPESEIIVECEPFDVLISTWGGIAMNMFAIYDTMRLLKEECDIGTVGLGKVMSAGVLLLAAGTKGRRKIGKHCRIMIHSVIGGHSGAIHNLENEMEEVRWIQEQYINSLVEETNMTKKYLKKLLERKVNVYLTAQEAVELGIADEIF